jgi:tetratricopeptide (TPR) repeat protein
MKFFLSLIVFFTFFLQTTFASLAQNYYKQGLEAETADEKLKYFTITLKLDPDFSDALIAKAEALFQLNDLDAAQKDVETYLEKYPPTARAFTLSGNLAQRRGQLIKAETHYENALKLEPKYDEASLRKGLLLILIGKLDEKTLENAVVFFKNVPEASPFFEASVLQAARSLETLARFEDALLMHEKLTRKNPNSAISFFHLGRLQYMSDQHPAALASIDLACDLTFKDQTHKVFYGVFRYFLAAQTMKDDTSAAYPLDRFLDKMPESLLGNLFQGKISDQEYLDQALRLDPKLSEKRKQALRCEIHCHLGYYYLLKNKTDDAFTHFGKAIENNLFGFEFYSMAKFEHQKLAIHREINPSK